MTADTEPVHPLITEAAKKAAICWVGVEGRPSASMWCVWLDDALCVVCGPGEQADPGLSGVDQCRITLRGDHNGRIVTFAADVVPVRPDSPEWTDTAGGLAAKRLNTTGDTIGRWADGNGVYRLVPRPGSPESGAGLPTDSQAAPPRPSPAARPTRKPFRLHRVKGRR